MSTFAGLALILTDKEPLSRKEVADLVVRQILVGENEMEYDQDEIIKALMGLYWVISPSTDWLRCQQAEDYYRNVYGRVFEKELGRKPSDGEGWWPDCMDIKGKWSPSILKRVASLHAARDAQDTKAWFDFCKKRDTN